jgi:hypothetical protein
MITEERKSTYQLHDVRGRITAHQAWELVTPRVVALDQRAYLGALASGEDIDAEGRSREWFLSFVLPTERGDAWYEFQPSDYEDDQAALLLHENVKPFGTLDRWRTARSEMTELWRRVLARSQPLPVPFRDSSDSVQDFIAQGLDFGAGPTNMTLSAHVLANGSAVWSANYYDENYTVPFEAGTTGSPR